MFSNWLQRLFHCRILPSIYLCHTLYSLKIWYIMKLISYIGNYIEVTSMIQKYSNMIN